MLYALVFPAHSAEYAESQGCAAMATVSNWMANNKLILNPTKTELMVLATKNSTPYQPTLTVGNDVLQKADAVRFLGIKIDPSLNWHPHIETLCKKLGSVVYLIRNLSPRIDSRTLKTVYFALFESLLRYGIECWGDSSEVNRVFKMQKKAIRALAGTWDQRVSCRPLFSSLGILPLPALYILGLSVHAHKLHLPQNCDVHSYDTRNRSRLHLEGCRLTSTLNSPVNLGARLLNCLPLELVALPEKAFKKKLKELLQGTCPYSVNEFIDHQASV